MFTAHAATDGFASALTAAANSLSCPAASLAAAARAAMKPSRSPA
ncbi:hypothetical protein ACX5I6_01240 [Arthrobacter sp. MMS24-T111]